MSERICDVESCGLPVTEAFVCSHCAWTLKQDLKAVPGLEEDLLIVLARLTRYSDQHERIRTGMTWQLPFHDPASETAWQLRNTLTAWVCHIAAQRDWTLPDGQPPTMSDMASWLSQHIEWIRHQPIGHQTVEEIAVAVREALRVTDLPNLRTRFKVGPCPDCTGTVWAYIPAREDRPAHMDCNHCGERWESVQFLNAGKRIVATEAQRIAPYIDSSAAAVALGVSTRRIRQLCTSGVLTNHGTPGRILLDLAEIDTLRTRRNGGVPA